MPVRVPRLRGRVPRCRLLLATLRRPGEGIENAIRRAVARNAAWVNSHE